MKSELTHADYNPATERFRCNEFLFGCQQVKPVNDFSHQRAAGRLNPDLCDSCLRHMEVTFGVNSKQIETLVMVRHQEHSLIVGAKELSKGKDISGPLRILKADKVNRIRGYTMKLLEAFEKGGTASVVKVWKAYQKWWMEQIGIEPVTDTKKEMEVMVTKVAAGAALPVGDRA